MTTLLDAPAPPTWLADLEREVLEHPTLAHPLVERLAAGPTSATWATFALQHHALVNCFTKYMELLLVNAPDSNQKLWIAKVLIDEYGEGSEGHDHGALYRTWAAELGLSARQLERTLLAPEVWDFVGRHLTLVRDEPFLFGLGALGPGHEWAIPTLFARLLPGLVKSGFTREQRLYFDLHTEQDVQHGAWMRNALESLVVSAEGRAEVRRGALSSLEARGRLWDAILARIDAPTAEHPTAGTLAELREAVAWFVRGQGWPRRASLASL